MSDKTPDPERFDRLNAADQDNYKKMQKEFYNTLYTNQKTKSFPKVFAKIDSFVQKDPLRGFICGFFRVNVTKLLVNIRQLRLLLCCCKSQTNNLLRRAGFVPTQERPKNSEVGSYLCLHPNDPSIKCWSYRVIPQNLEDQEEPAQEDKHKGPKVTLNISKNHSLQVLHEDPAQGPIIILELEGQPFTDTQIIPEPEMYSIPSPLPVEYDAYNDFDPIDIEVDISDPRDYLL